jgi:hypothetical protein
MIKIKNIRNVIVLIMLAILLTGTVQALTHWYDGAFYIVRDTTGNPMLSYVKGDIVTLSLENELDSPQTIYTQYVGKIKNVNTGKIIKPYTKLPSKVAIPFGGTYGTAWKINVPPGKYQACAIAANSKNNKKELCTQTFKIFSKPTAELTVVTFAKSYNIGQSVPFGITGTGTLPTYVDTIHYTIINADTNTPYVMNVVGYLLEKMDGGSSTYDGFDWDQKISGVQAPPGRYKFRWYWGNNPSPVPKNKYADSAIFRIK